MIDITGLATALLALIGAAITTYVIPWIKAKTTAEQRRAAQMLVKTAVYAAEQLYKGSGRGAEKLQYVRERLEAAGVNLDTGLIADMIQAAVLELAITQDWGLDAGYDGSAPEGLNGSVG